MLPKNILILGTGLTGNSLINFCKQYQIDYYIFDENKQNVNIINNIEKIEWNKIETIALSPGFFNEIKPHKIFEISQKLNKKIISDLDIFFQILPKNSKTIGITGTNGKSTTVALITHILNQNNISAISCGNIGIPFLNVIDEKYAFYVCEVSSYQLSLSNPKFNFAGVLNITPDHLDKHKNFESYKKAKEKIFNEAIPIFNEKIENLPHINTNVENINLSYNICKKLGISHENIIKAIENFQPLKHRTEFIRKIGNISFINDSKATNVIATQNALKLFKNIHLILGGKSKKDQFFNIKDFKNVQNIYLIGEAIEEFSTYLSKMNIQFEISYILENAINSAYTNAKLLNQESTILLSPACASFDQFNNFEHRGEIFTNFIKNLNNI